jgi:hypothetical protein
VLPLPDDYTTTYNHPLPYDNAMSHNYSKTHNHSETNNSSSHLRNVHVPGRLSFDQGPS